MTDKRENSAIMTLDADYSISDEVLHHIALGTAARSGESFFCALVEHIAKAIEADMVFVTKCLTPDRSEVKTLAHWFKGALADDFEYEIAPFPCTHVMQGKVYIQFSNLLDDYPEEMEEMESYIGIPLVSTKDEILGHIVVMNERSLEKQPKGLSALRIFATRAAAELERLQSEEKLKTSEERYRLLFDANPLPIFVFDVDTYEILDANRYALRAYGYDEVAIKAMRMNDFVPQEEHERFDEWMKKPLQPNQPWDCVFTHRTKDGQQLTVQLSRRFLRFEGRAACLSLVNDITERRRIEQERDEAYQSLEQRVMERTYEIERRQQIAESSRDALKTINSQAKIENVIDHITQQATILLGADAVVTCQYLEDDKRCILQAQHGLQTVLSADPPPGWQLIQNRVDEMAPIAINNGKIFASSASNVAYQQQFQALLAVPLTIRTSAYGYLILYYLDPRSFSEEETRLAVTFADQMALALENSDLRQEAEAFAVMEERNRLARDLHDAVTQTLWSASLLADVIPDIWHKDQQRAQTRLEQLAQLNRIALQEMRALLLGLRPKSLVETKMEDLLGQLLATLQEQTQAQIELVTSGELRDTPADVQIAYYRVAQEALNNVIRHSEATRVVMHLACNDGHDLVLTIEDNGKGFDPENITPNHFGTKIMRERAASIDADLKLLSHVGTGTKVEMTWLYKKASS